MEKEFLKIALFQAFIQISFICARLNKYLMNAWIEVSEKS